MPILLHTCMISVPKQWLVIHNHPWPCNAILLDTILILVIIIFVELVRRKASRMTYSKATSTREKILFTLQSVSMSSDILVHSCMVYPQGHGPNRFISWCVWPAPKTVNTLMWGLKVGWVAQVARVKRAGQRIWRGRTSQPSCETGFGIANHFWDVIASLVSTVGWLVTDTFNCVGVSGPSRNVLRPCHGMGCFIYFQI